MGNNVRIVRGASLSSNESMDDRFDIFNPELDDSDSDENQNSSTSNESDDDDSADSNSSVESVVSASKTDPKDDVSETKTDPKEDTANCKIFCYFCTILLFEKTRSIFMILIWISRVFLNGLTAEALFVKNGKIGKIVFKFSRQKCP